MISSFVSTSFACYLLPGPGVLSSLQAFVVKLQGVAMSQQSNENKAVRAELEKLQQAVDELQRGMAAAAHVAG